MNQNRRSNERKRNFMRKSREKSHKKKNKKTNQIHIYLVVVVVVVFMNVRNTFVLVVCGTVARVSRKCHGQTMALMNELSLRSIMPTL